MYLSIYVDDGLAAASDERVIEKLFCELSKELRTTNTKNVTNFLGVEIYRLKNVSIFISQHKYVQNILEKLNLTEANSVFTPIDVNWDANISYKKACKSP